MTTAIILAGGFGTRLRSVIGESVPKPMAEIAGKPFLSYWLHYLARQGVTKAILSLHHQPQYFKDCLGTEHAGIPLEYVWEPTPLGTGGALKHVFASRAITGPVLVTNGDSFVQCDVPAMLARHEQADVTLSIGVVHTQDTGRYGAVTIENGSITAFHEKQFPGVAGYINCGIYILSPSIIQYFPESPAFSFEKDCIMPHIAELKPCALITTGDFIDIGIPEDYQRALTQVPQMLGSAILS